MAGCRAAGPAKEGGAVPALCLLLCLGLGALQAWHLWQTAALRDLLQLQQQRLAALERALPPDQLLVSLGASRQRRAVASGAQETSAAGVPIVAAPYGYRPGLHENKPAMRTYHSFGTTTQNPDSETILPHHRSSATFHGTQLGRVNADPAPPAAAPPATQLAAEPAALHHRRSRVKQATVQAKKARQARRWQVPRKRTDVKLVDPKQRNAKRMQMRGVKSRQVAEVLGAPTSFSSRPSSVSSDHRSPASTDHGAPAANGASSDHRHPANSGANRRHRRLIRRLIQSELRQSMEEMRQSLEALRQSMGTTAVHLEGHTTNYPPGEHPHLGNGILRNIQPNCKFADWQFAPWVYSKGYSRDFTLQDGHVTVKKPGVYYLYAQINYLDASDMNGFQIMVSDRSFAKCLTNEPNSSRNKKVNTCHTSGVTYLDTGDTVSIRDLECMRISMFSSDRSFFGLVRLAGTDGDNGPRRQRRSPSSWIN